MAGEGAGVKEVFIQMFYVGWDCVALSGRWEEDGSQKGGVEKEKKKGARGGSY